MPSLSSDLIGCLELMNIILLVDRVRFDISSAGKCHSRDSGFISAAHIFIVLLSLIEMAEMLVRDFSISPQSSVALLFGFPSFLTCCVDSSSSSSLST